MEKIYCVKDNNGSYNGSINICSNSMIKRNADWKWDYYSQTYPMSVNLGREDVERKIEKLRELNLLAEYENLDWEVIEFTKQEWTDLITENCKKHDELRRDRMLNWHYNSSIVIKEIKKGCIGAYRKAVRDIYRKYKSKNT